MRTVTINERSKDRELHIEAPGCIVNIIVGLTNNEGHRVTHVSILADGDRFCGSPAWWINGEKENNALGLRVVQAISP